MKLVIDFLSHDQISDVFLSLKLFLFALKKKSKRRITILCCEIFLLSAHIALLYALLYVQVIMIVRYFNKLIREFSNKAYDTFLIMTRNWWTYGMALETYAYSLVDFYFGDSSDNLFSLIFVF